MILTGKCKEGFEDWYNSNIGKKINVGHLSLYTLSENMVYSVIIDYFDSIGVYINIKSYSYLYDWSYEIKQLNKKTIVMEDKPNQSVKSRKEATEKAIEKANEILNKEL